MNKVIRGGLTAPRHLDVTFMSYPVKTTVSAIILKKFHSGYELKPII